MIEQIMTWIGPTLDVAAVILLAAVLWRLGRDPGAAWGERETRLAAIFDDLRGLVAQSEGLARDLDAKLAGRETRLRALLDEAEATLAAPAPPAARPDRIAVREPTAQPAAATASSAAALAMASGPAPSAPTADAEAAALAGRIEALADAGTPVDEIARRVGVAAAEVRLVIGLKTARAARRRHAAEGARALA